MFIHKNKLFKLLVSYSIAAMGLNLFFILAGNIHFDINVLLFSSLLWGLEAAETAVVLFLFIVTANCLAIINIKTRLYCYNTIHSLCLRFISIQFIEIEWKKTKWSEVNPFTLHEFHSTHTAIHLNSMNAVLSELIQCLRYTSFINHPISFRLRGAVWNGLIHWTPFHSSLH